MIELHLLLLLLLLLKLKAHEFVLLLSNCRIFDSLTFERLVLLLQVLDDLFELLDAFAINLVFFLLSLGLGKHLSLEALLQSRVRAG